MGATRYSSERHAVNESPARKPEGIRCSAPNIDTNVDAARSKRALLQLFFRGGVGVELHGGLPFGDGFLLPPGGVEDETESPVGGAGGWGMRLGILDQILAEITFGAGQVE